MLQAISNCISNGHLSGIEKIFASKSDMIAREIWASLAVTSLRVPLPCTMTTIFQYSSAVLMNTTIHFGDVILITWMTAPFFRPRRDTIKTQPQPNLNSFQKAMFWRFFLIVAGLCLFPRHGRKTGGGTSVNAKPHLLDQFSDLQHATANQTSGSQSSRNRPSHPNHSRGHPHPHPTTSRQQSRQVSARARRTTRRPPRTRS